MNQQQLKMLKEAYQSNANNYKRIADYLKTSTYRDTLDEALNKLIEMLTESSDMMSEMLSKIEEVGKQAPVADRFIQKPLNHGTGKSWTEHKAAMGESQFKALYQGEFPPKEKQYGVPPNFVPKSEAREPIGRANSEGIPMVTQMQMNAVYGIGSSKGMSKDELKEYCKNLYGCSISELTKNQASELLDKLRDKHD